ncbi:MAG TPA: hypothetical protein VGD81_07410 [Opitutaceae bacterium]
MNNAFAFASLHVVHVLALLGVMGSLCYRAALARESRRSGVPLVASSILILVTGVVMTRAAHPSMPPWVWTKALSFFGIVGCAFLAYRIPAKTSLWLSLAFTFAAVALVVVYLRPF